MYVLVVCTICMYPNFGAYDDLSSMIKRKQFNNHKTIPSEY